MNYKDQEVNGDKKEKNKKKEKKTHWLLLGVARIPIQH